MKIAVNNIERSVMRRLDHCEFCIVFFRFAVEFAIERAAEKGEGTLMLTSKPARVAANALYRSAGFQPKETNVYRFPIGVKD